MHVLLALILGSSLETLKVTAREPESGGTHGQPVAVSITFALRSGPGSSMTCGFKRIAVPCLLHT